MCTPKPNNCKIDFICDDETCNCYQYKHDHSIKDSNFDCCHNVVVDEYNEFKVLCKSKICQVNKGILFLREQLGDDNLREYIKGEIV